MFLRNYFLEIFFGNRYFGKNFLYNKRRYSKGKRIRKKENVSGITKDGKKNDEMFFRNVERSSFLNL